MAIYRKTVIDEYIREVEDYYQQVRSALVGSPPNPNKEEAYNQTPEHFKRDFSEVDFDLVMRRIDRFGSTVKSLRQLKGKQEKPLHRP